MAQAILTSADIAGIHSIVHGILKDTSLGSKTFTFRMTGVTVSAFDPTTQIIPAMYAESSVSAFKGSYSLEEVRDSEGGAMGEGKSNALLEYGDVKLIVNVSSVTGVLSVDDQVYESGTSYQSGTTYEIKSIGKDPLSIAYFLQCRAI